MWKNEDAKQPAIVQKVNAKERTAELLLYSGKVELVPVLELDVHGSDAIQETPHDSFGARVGDLAFIHAEGSTNGFEKPMVPVIGELEAWAYEAPVQEETGEYSGWRKDLNVLGTTLAQDVPPRVDSFGKVKLNGDLSIDWFGEVVNLALNGMVDVRLANGQMRTVGIRQLQVLGDASYMDEMMGGPHEHAAEWFDDGMDVDGEDGVSQASWETMTDASGGGSDMSADALDDEADMDEEEHDRVGSAHMDGEIDEDEQERRDVEEVDPMVNPVFCPAK